MRSDDEAGGIDGKLSFGKSGGRVGLTEIHDVVRESKAFYKQKQKFGPYRKRDGFCYFIPCRQIILDY